MQRVILAKGSSHLKKNREVSQQYKCELIQTLVCLGLEKSIQWRIFLTVSKKKILLEVCKSLDNKLQED